jgi:hypothetical protein
MIETTRRNGTGVALPINTVDIALDDIGYPGWVVSMRTNPRSSVFDDFMNAEDVPRWWKAFGRIVHTWNFADEDGQALPLPHECESERDLDLPVGVVAFIFRRYVEEFRASVGLPKVPELSSETSSAISAEAQTGG